MISSLRRHFEDDAADERRGVIPREMRVLCSAGGVADGVDAPVRRLQALVYFDAAVSDRDA
jgi:hypothetical protein